MESLVSTWRAAAKPWSPADAYVLVEALLITKAYELLLDRLSNIYKYGLIPRQRDVECLLRGFRDQCSSTSTSSNSSETAQTPEDSRMQALDNCYKTFGVALYNHIAPTQEMYIDLIIAGLRTGTEEGRRRSTVTRGEAMSLGFHVPELDEL